jgi:hypothetical protein
LAALKQELSSDPGASSRRRQAARERAARDVQERAGKARASLERLQAERKSRAKTHAKDEAKKKEPKASTTDPEARFMRFPDGAIRPAYNAQIAAAPKEGVIVAIAVTDRRNDAGLAEPRVNDIVRRYGRTPERLLVDTSYATSEDIVALAAHAAGPVSVYTPPNEKETVKPATLARRIRKRAKEPSCLKAWRERMASEAGQAVYGLRQRIERINADRKNHGFGFLPVRGLIKAKAHALWHALANNLVAARRLRIETPCGAHQVITLLPSPPEPPSPQASDWDLNPSKYKNPIPSHARKRE